jgi:hypothetical protein
LSWCSTVVPCALMGMLADIRKDFSTAATASSLSSSTKAGRDRPAQD